MNRRIFCQTTGLAAGSLLFPDFLARAAARSDGAQAITFGLQVATGGDFGPASLLIDTEGLPAPAFEMGDLAPNTTYYWRANATDGVITSEWSDVYDFSTASSVGVESGETPESHELGANYPNPFNPTTTIPFRLAEAGPVRMQVFNELGQQVAVLVDDYRSAGAYEVVWDARDLASGVYLCVLQAGSFTQTRRMVLVK